MSRFVRDDKTPSKQTKKSVNKPEKPASLKSPPPNTLLSASEVLPSDLILIPVAQTTLFPGMIIPLILPEGKLTKTVEFVMEKNSYVGAVLFKSIPDEDVATGPPMSITGLPAEGTDTQIQLGRDPKDGTPKGPSKVEFYPFGVVCKVIKRINLPDNQVSILLTGLQRFEIRDLIKEAPHFAAKVTYIYDEVNNDNELEALLRSCLSQFKQLSRDNPLISEEVKVALVNIDGPGKLVDLMASVLIRDVQSYQMLLSLGDVKLRLQHLLLILKKEMEVHLVQKRIHDEINQKIGTTQREYYLQEQLKLIQKELGRHGDEKTRVLAKFEERLSGKSLPKEAKDRLSDEMERVRSLHEHSSEFAVAINYLDWATSLPWGVLSTENYDLKSAREVLEKDHYGLKDVKSRILEFLAVKKLKKTSAGSIICFVGPPGTGKTSLGRSIAKALNRKFFRFSVGGMRDEAEIKGHRRTYVGAMPGKVIQGLKRSGTQNPVFLIDEVDKIGTGWASGGDPASALLEVLDSEQNVEFLDHYLDISFDLSNIFFITTANTTDTIPHALMDRMEVIDLHGYTDFEKLEIAKRHLIPKATKESGVSLEQLRFSDSGLNHIISQYARESGVRNLEKQIAKICRKVAYRLASGSKKQVLVKDTKEIQKFLGNPPYAPEIGFKKMVPGVAMGLAWTLYGGEILFVEASSVEGKGGFMLTGSMGEVMEESANIGYTFIRERAKELKLAKNYFDEHVLHLHLPAGAIPKDGPSAGITMATSLYSLLSDRVVKDHLAMTGELTLTGRVLPVGGIKEKFLAAKRAGVKNIIIPKANEKDLKELESDVTQGLKIFRVSTVDEVLKIALK